MKEEALPFRAMVIHRQSNWLFFEKIEYKFYQYYKSLSPEILKSMLKDYGKLKFVKEQYAVSLFVLISTKKVENTVQAENLLKIIEYKFKQRCKSEEYFLNMEIFIKNKINLKKSVTGLDYSILFVENLVNNHCPKGQGFFFHRQLLIIIC